MLEGIGKRLAEDFNAWIANKHRAEEFEIKEEKRKRRNNTRAVARYRWEKAYGPIPPGHEIHHIDGNPENNDLNNLSCLSKEAHIKKHQEKT